MPVIRTISRAIRSVHQIELSSKCSLSCVYCPSSKIVAGEFPSRSAKHMSRETFEQALSWVSYFVQQGTQGDELNLAGIGESTLHPHLAEFIGRAREALGTAPGPSSETRRIVFATNGTHFTEEHARALAKAAPAHVWVSMHRPEKAGPAIELAKAYGVFSSATLDPIIAPNTWAGQIKNKWSEGMGLSGVGAAYKLSCDWLKEGRAFVLSDGRVSPCCLDAAGQGVVGHVADDPAKARTGTYSLCAGCHHSLRGTDLDKIVATGGSVG